MSLSRADFQAIAQALLSRDPLRNTNLVEPSEIEIAYLQWKNDCNAVATALSTTNPHFDHTRFLTACGAD